MEFAEHYGLSPYRADALAWNRCLGRSGAKLQRAAPHPPLRCLLPAGDCPREEPTCSRRGAPAAESAWVGVVAARLRRRPRTGAERCPSPASPSRRSLRRLRSPRLPAGGPCQAGGRSWRRRAWPSPEPGFKVSPSASETQRVNPGGGREPLEPTAAWAVLAWPCRLWSAPLRLVPLHSTAEGLALAFHLPFASHATSRSSEALASVFLQGWWQVPSIVSTSKVPFSW